MLTELLLDYLIWAMVAHFGLLVKSFFNVCYKIYYNFHLFSIQTIEELVSNYSDTNEAWKFSPSNAIPFHS